SGPLSDFRSAFAWRTERRTADPFATPAESARSPLWRGLLLDRRRPTLPLPRRSATSIVRVQRRRRPCLRRVACRSLRRPYWPDLALPRLALCLTPEAAQLELDLRFAR